MLFEARLDDDTIEILESNNLTELNLEGVEGEILDFYSVEPNLINKEKWTFVDICGSRGIDHVLVYCFGL